MTGIGANVTWEYLTLPEREADDDQLARLGQQGWELVIRGTRFEDAVLYFKRRLPSFREVVTLDQRRAYYATLGYQGDEAGRLNL